MVITYDLPALLIEESDFSVPDNKMFMRNLKNKSNIKLIKNINFDDRYCFNYALGDNLQSCEEGEDILQDEYYNIEIEYVKKGDIVSFYDEDLANTLHFAIVDETDGTLEGIRIKSKWGNGGVFKTDLKQLPKSYGRKIKFWRKEK